MQINPQFRNSSVRFYRFPLDQEVEGSRADRFRVDRATLLDYLLSLLARRPGISVSRRLRRGDEYFTARTARKIVAVGRICYADTDEVSLHAGEAALISFHTDPNYRGRGLYVHLIREMLRYLKRKGYTAAYIWADSGNPASIRGIERAGFMPVPVDSAFDRARS